MQTRIVIFLTLFIFALPESGVADSTCEHVELSQGVPSETCSSDFSKNSGLSFSGNVVCHDTQNPEIVPVLSCCFVTGRKKTILARECMVVGHHQGLVDVICDSEEHGAIDGTCRIAGYV